MKKRILSLLIAGAMMLSLATVVSADNPALDTPTGSRTNVGEGETVYKNTKVFAVGLPLDAAFDFVLDPQGLLNANAGDTLEAAAANGGKIVFTENAAIINNSSVDVAVTAALRVTGGATVVSTPGDAGAKPNVSAGNSVAIFASPAKESVSDAEAAYVSSDKGYLLGNSTTAAQITTLKFVLEAAEYKLGANPIADELALVEDSGNGTQLQFGGWVNPDADWSAFSASATLARVPASAQITAWNNNNPANNGKVAADLKLYVNHTDPLNSTAANLIAVPTATDLSALVPVTAITAAPTGARVAGDDAAIAAGAPYKSANTAYDGQWVKSAAITAANNSSANAATRVATVRAWGASATAATDADVVWLPVGVSDPEDLLESKVANSAAKTIGITAVFSYAEATATESEATKVANTYGLLAQGTGASLNLTAREVVLDEYVWPAPAFGFKQGSAEVAVTALAGAATALTYYEVNLAADVWVTGLSYTVTRGGNTTAAITPTVGTAGTAATVNTWINQAQSSNNNDGSPRVGLNLSTTAATVIPTASANGVSGPLAAGDVLTVTITGTDGVSSKIVITLT